MTFSEDVSGMTLRYFFEHKDMECFNFKRRHKDGSNLCVPCWSRLILKSLAKQYGWKNLEALVKRHRKGKRG